MKAQDIKAQLMDRMQEVAEFLLPEGQLTADQMQWNCGDCNGTPGSSFYLDLYNDNAGVWCDFGAVDDAERGGDILKLWQLARGVDFKTACAEAQAFLDGCDMEPTVSGKPTTDKPRTNGKAGPKAVYSRDPVKEWEYRKGGQLVGLVKRFDALDGSRAKEVRPFFKPDGNGGFLPGYPEDMRDNRPLYGDLPNKAGNIIITEGEKACDAVRQMGFPACTSLGGCKAAGKADWSLLKDAKQVRIWADHDEPGLAYARDAAQEIHQVAPEATIKILTYGKDKEDAADFLYHQLEEQGLIWDEHEDILAGEPKPDLKPIQEALQQLFKTAAVPWQPPADTAEPETSPAAGSGKSTNRKFHGGLVLEPFAGLRPKSIEWMWQGKYALGKFGLCAGMPDVGKTTVLMDMAARISTGDPWPFSDERREPGKVLLFSAEDDSADTLLPRLLAAGGNPVNVVRVRASYKVTDKKKGTKEQTAFTLAADLQKLDQTLATHPDIQAVVMDPISAYLGARNAHSEANVRSVLEPVTEVLEKRKVALLGIAHFSKRDPKTVGHVMHLVTGSGGLVAAARSTWVCVKIDGEDQRYFLRLKNNNAKDSDAEGCCYRLEGAVVTDPDTGEPVETSRVVWTSTWHESAEQLFQRLRYQSKAPQRAEAASWLVQLLADGPMPANEITQASKYPEATLKRAKKEANITSHRVGFGDAGEWYWFLPEDDREFTKLVDQGTPSDEAVSKVIRYPQLPACLK